MSPEDQKGYLALAMNGGQLLHHAAYQLLREGRPSYSETRYWMLVSTLNRQDRKTAALYLDDWTEQDRRGNRKRTARVSKFTPGDHYHVLGEKFGTLDEAISHARSNGYEYGGLDEQYVYREE